MTAARNPLQVDKIGALLADCKNPEEFIGDEAEHQSEMDHANSGLESRSD